MVTQTQAGVRQKELPSITNAVCLTKPQSGHNNAFLLGSSEPVLKRWSSHIISFLLFPVQMECLTPRSSSKMLKVLALTVTRREAQENVYRLPNRSQGRLCNKVHENSPILCSSIIEKHSSLQVSDLIHQKNHQDACISFFDNPVSESCIPLTVVDPQSLWKAPPWSVVTLAGLNTVPN